MNKQPKIEIKQLDKGIVQIYVDGHELNGVRYFKLEAHAADTPILTVDLNAFNLSVEGNYELHHLGMGQIEDIRFAGQDSLINCQ